MAWYLSGQSDKIKQLERGLLELRAKLDRLGAAGAPEPETAAHRPVPEFLKPAPAAGQPAQKQEQPQSQPAPAAPAASLLLAVNGLFACHAYSGRYFVPWRAPASFFVFLIIAFWNLISLKPGLLMSGVMMAFAGLYALGALTVPALAGSRQV